ncbi:hypothetical protein SAMN04487906_0749 [Zhouia amylolytica]|uniref:Uncharacterized protein n=2 Tax=Zhouia amylolytica TaxID=376730 RepID=W2URF2_9FLAO|nr:hypothetical protein [Zhouia amylolytica]ETN95887.1 hypothetical protein P278_16090 [Zhouia amylolytica AD3]MCQ0111987.1 hypothetical protein [Zhouia amylolytica]SFS53946.1 hypothetical protein SAMN04487906_0749 [Zhouia amylolytica]
MLKKNTALLIALIIITGILLIKVFSNDSSYRQIQDELNQSRIALEKAIRQNSVAQKEIHSLQQELNTFKLKNEILLAEKDSLVLLYKRKKAQNWSELQEIKKEQTLVLEKLKSLREENIKFK